MAYVGQQFTKQATSTSSQRFSGNAVDLEFALQRGVNRSSDIIVHVGGNFKVPDVDYSAFGTRLIFTSAPSSGTNNITVTFLAGSLNTLFLNANLFPQGTEVSPSIAYSLGTTTGIYFPSTTSLGLVASGNARVTVTNDPIPVSTTTGALRVQGGIGATESIYCGNVMRVSGTLNSTSTTTGALVVSGGAGFSNDVFIGGSLQTAGDFVVAGTFVTTGSESLSVNDPFLFLATGNAGDSLDIGFTGQYVGLDSIVRYAGLFRDVTDSKYKLFANLTNPPTTVVDTANVSFAYADLVLSTITVTSPVSGIINGGTNGVGNIGSSSQTFNTVYAKATTAQYADLAEKYLADAEYEPGTVLHFGGEKEVAQCNVDHCTRIAGVVSTAPGFIMNEALTGDNTVQVALLGRVPTKVQGIVKKGDMLVSAGNGRARSESNPKLGAVLGKAVEDHDSEGLGVIEILVGRI